MRIFLGESMDSAAASRAGDVIPKNAVVTGPTPDDSIFSPATIVLIVSVIGLVFIGLIRSETRRDLRTLTAAGASAQTRRALAGVTTAAIGFLGAALGAVAGVLAVLAWARADLTMVFGNVPWGDIGLLVIGMPLIGAAAGWLLGGRQPSAVSRQPLE